MTRFEAFILKLLPTILISTLVCPTVTFAKSCAAMTKELEQLRLESQTYARSPSARSGGVTFEQLAEILDKIVELKAVMRKSNCKIPERNVPRSGKTR